jgi:hypothetical protein
MISIELFSQVLFFHCRAFFCKSELRTENYTFSEQAATRVIPGEARVNTAAADRCRPRRVRNPLVQLPPRLRFATLIASEKHVFRMGFAVKRGMLTHQLKYSGECYVLRCDVVLPGTGLETRSDERTVFIFRGDDYKPRPNSIR